MEINKDLQLYYWKFKSLVKDEALKELDEEKSIQIVINRIAELMEADDIQIYRMDKETGKIYSHTQIGKDSPILLLECFNYLKNDNYNENIIDDKSCNELTIFEVETEKNRYAVAIKSSTLVDEDIKKEQINVAKDICSAVIPIKEYTKRLKNEAYFDALTGTYSRKFYNIYIDEYLGNKSKEMTVSMIDLFRLHFINNNFDHIVGDKYIIEAANAIKENVESNDMIFRTGGDEFVVISTRVNKENMLEKLENANLILKKCPLTLELASPLLINYGVAEGNNTYINLLQQAEKELKLNKDETYIRLGYDRRSQIKK
ncbi:MAG: GGDEF domain-containing protein [Clostridia bacterium]|nr:GGDEF domain-containing protein [Clostridia bacterium]